MSRYDTADPERHEDEWGDDEAEWRGPADDEPEEADE